MLSIGAHDAYLVRDVVRRRKWDFGKTGSHEGTVDRDGNLIWFFGT
jgi:hypothetical protein